MPKHPTVMFIKVSTVEGSFRNGGGMVIQPQDIWQGKTAILFWKALEIAQNSPLMNTKASN
jgi:hypothetical protein